MEIDTPFKVIDTSLLLDQHGRDGSDKMNFHGLSVLVENIHELEQMRLRLLSKDGCGNTTLADALELVLNQKDAVSSEAKEFNEQFDKIAQFMALMINESIRRKKEIFYNFTRDYGD